ncbi:SCO7613 C-terminal domain-containing membrane protein [Krasilnikovia sp. M28-CT-15]|uniref:SCO7613 C-terminal domain-containing membrane protein n=1 Tax=Krasilnikovia sp. M28-CT-15 TaxID=3373540 RepID=UPI003876AE02
MAQGQQPDSYDEELARIDASIAELKIRDMAAAKERTQLAAKLQAAQFQRDILAHANAQKAKKAARRQRLRRRPAGADDPTTPVTGPPAQDTPDTDSPDAPPAGSPAAGSPAAGPPGVGGPPHPGSRAPGAQPGPGPRPAPTTGGAATTRAGAGSAYAGAGRRARPGGDGRTAVLDSPPSTEHPGPPPRTPHLEHPHEHPPETSTQSVQNILLGLGALLLGVAAVVFAGVAVSNSIARALVLGLAAAAALYVAPRIAQRGLTSTGETVAAVGLVLLPMSIYALHGSALVGGHAVPVSLYLGITFAITAVAAFVYAGSTRLSAPRYGTVVALQPVAPLLAYPAIESPAGWGVALTAVAIIDLLLLTTVIRSGPLLPHWPLLSRLVPGGRQSTDARAARAAGATDFTGRDAAPRPAGASAPDAAEPGPGDAGPGNAGPGNAGPGNAGPGNAGPGGAEPAGTGQAASGAAAGSTAPDQAEPTGDAPPRPESRPEEPDLIIGALASPSRLHWAPAWLFPEADPATTGPAPVGQPATPSSGGWLRELTYALLWAAVTGALIYAGAALISADTVADAVRSGIVLVLAAAVAAAAARLLDNVTARNVAGGVLTLAVIAACARVADVASPPWMFAVAAAAVAVTGLAVHRVPEEVRRGPQLASAGALTMVGLFVALDALRAALAPVQAARPVWHADTAGYAEAIAQAAPAGWLLALSALLVTVAAAVALPADIRHEGAVAGIAVTALAVPASLGLPWAQAPWPLVLAAIGLGAAGLAARTRRIAIAHITAAGVVGLFGAAAALSASWLTAAVLTALAGAGMMTAIGARQVPVSRYAWLVGDWAAAAAALALPGAAVTAVLAMHDRGDGPPATEAVTVPALALGFLAVAGTLTYAAVFQVARREISLPLTVGTGLGAVALALAAILAPGATPPDVWVGALLLTAAGLLFFARSIDSGRRADRMLDGPDIAAAAATVAICGALARVTALAFPHAPLVVAGLVVLVVALGVRALPEDWRRGPVRGLGLAGAVVGGIAAWQALSAGLRVIAAPGPVWASDLTHHSPVPPAGAWQAPITLVLVAMAAAAALPRPLSYDIAAGAAAIATIGAPACFGLPWWAPLLVGGAVALAYGIGAVAATDPRAAMARAGVAAAVAVHFVAVGLVRPWSTAVALGFVVLIGLVVATLCRTDVPLTGTSSTDPDGTANDYAGEAVYPPASPGHAATGSIRADTPDWPRAEVVDEELALARDDTGMPRHRAQIGGAATASVLLAAPGLLAAIAAGQGRSAPVVLTAALAGSCLCLAVLALVARWIPQYLPWATIGLVGGATITAFVSLPVGYRTALYAATAALLGVLAELLRGATPAPGITVAPTNFWTDRRGYARPRWTSARPSGLRGRWLVDPATGAVAVALVPTVLALISLAPALKGALVDPLKQLDAIWQGPVTALTDPTQGNVDATAVLAAVLLTVAAALAATGFGGRPAESVPVVLPGLAITLLIAPIGLNAAWPASTMAALVVFTISMLGLALTPPPVAARRTLLGTTRTIVFVIGLLAGGAGLAGSLATQRLTLFTLGSAVGVGLVGAMAGRTAHARILGWLFAAVMAQFFVLTVALVAGLTPAWAAFGVLTVGAALLILEATLPWLGRPEAAREAATVEWSGYASALLAGALALNSPRHLAALLAAWGAVLGLAASRPGRTTANRRTLFWLAVGFEVVGWWLFMTLADVALPEAYTLPFAALALLVGVLEVRMRPELSSWAAYGPSLLAAFVPTTGIVLATDAGDLRELMLLLGAVVTLIIGSRMRQQAPVVVGAVVTAIAALHFAVTLVGPWLVLVPLGVGLLFLGATNENRRRTQERLRGALVRLR